MEHSSTQQAFIEASPETIWELVGDPNRHPDWWPGVVDVDCADLREGCSYREVVKGFFKPQEHDIVIERPLENLRRVGGGARGTLWGARSRPPRSASGPARSAAGRAAAAEARARP